MNFYGRKFVINPNVLTPRPESEAIIEILKSLPLEPKNPKIADIGTGSGALGITAAIELNNACVDLLEIDPFAIKVAKFNVERLTTGIKVIEADLLEGSLKDYDVLLCNLPYVPDNHKLNKAAKHEPFIALFGLCSNAGLPLGLLWRGPSLVTQSLATVLRSDFSDCFVNQRSWLRYGGSILSRSPRAIEV